MLLLLYRSLLPDNFLPNDQRWRVIELDEPLIAGLDTESDTFESAAIKRVNEGRAQFVDPIPFDSDVHVVDTDTLDTWSLKLKVEKA